MKHRKIKAVLFDLDGTLLDTDRLIWAGYHYLFRKYRPDYELSDEELLEFLGPPLNVIFPRYFEEDGEKLFKEYRKFYANMNPHDFVTIFPGVLETLNYLKDNNYRMGIVTTKETGSAIESLADFNLNHFFDTVIGYDLVAKHKPHPEGVLKAADVLGVNPEETIFVGDNASDILAGKGAGSTSIGIGWSKKGTKHLEEVKPHSILKNMLELIDVIRELEESGTKDL